MVEELSQPLFASSRSRASRLTHARRQCLPPRDAHLIPVELVKCREATSAAGSMIEEPALTEIHPGAEPVEVCLADRLDQPSTAKRVDPF
jgi:hypothetical protein